MLALRRRTLYPLSYEGCLYRVAGGWEGPLRAGELASAVSMSGPAMRRSGRSGSALSQEPYKGGGDHAELRRLHVDCPDDQGLEFSVASSGDVGSGIRSLWDT